MPSLYADSKTAKASVRYVCEGSTAHRMSSYEPVTVQRWEHLTNYFIGRIGHTAASQVVSGACIELIVARSSSAGGSMVAALVSTPKANSA